MIPNTFEAYGVVREGASLDFLASYVSKIKRRNREDFINMGEAAGVEDSDSGTVLLGILWKPPAIGFEWGATLQHTEDIFRVVYTEANWTKTVYGLGMRASAQYTHQKSTGLGLLGKFKTNAKGVKLSTSYKNAVLSVSYTKTGDGARIRSPFGGRPGYTSSMLRNFDRAGEKAWRASLSYHFHAIGLPDWSANVMYMQGTGGLSDFIFDELKDNREVDYTLDYKPDHGRWQGLWFRVRYAHVREDGRGEVANQLRIILNYSISIL